MPRQDAEQRDAREEQLGAQDAGAEDGEAARRTTRGRRATGRTGGCRQPPASLPRQVERDRDDQEAVRVVLVGGPVVDQLHDDMPVENGQARGQDRERQRRRAAGGHMPVFGPTALSL